MAFLDFLKNRQASQQQPVANKPQEQKPETPTQARKREAALEQASRKPVTWVPPETQASFDSARALLEKATRHSQNDHQAPAATAPESTGSREAMRQNMASQKNVAPPLSPTSMQNGQTGSAGTVVPTEEVSAGVPAKTPAKAPDPPTRPRTLPRPRPSWER